MKKKKRLVLVDPDALPTSVDVFHLSPSPVSATTQKGADVRSTHTAVLKSMSGLEELESQGLSLKIGSLPI